MYPADICDRKCGGKRADASERVLKDVIRRRPDRGTGEKRLPNPNLGLYRELKSAGVPVMFVNSFYPEIDIPYVSLNDQKAGYIAARHLAECGHTGSEASSKQTTGRAGGGMPAICRR